MSMKATRCVSTLFAIAAIAVLFLAACGASGPEPGSPEALYVDTGCAKCHGPRGEGQRSGPPLDALSERWQQAELIEYLKDPKVFVESNPRLSYMVEQYPIAMLGYPDLPQEDLEKIAELLLEGWPQEGESQG
jgi:cytochrome c553